MSLEGGMEDGVLPLLNGHLMKEKGIEEGKGKDGEIRSKTSGVKPIGIQMQGKGSNGDTTLRPSSSSGLTTAEKEEEGLHLKHVSNATAYLYNEYSKKSNSNSKSNYTVTLPITLNTILTVNVTLPPNLTLGNGILPYSAR